MIVRLATVDDAEPLLAIYGPYVQQTAVTFETEVPSRAEMARRVANTLLRHPWLVAEEDETIVGYAYAHPFAERAAYRWSVETTVYVRPDRHRCGVGRAVYSSLLALLVRQGYRQAFAGIALPNPGSVGLHETMGFRQVGILHRVGWKLGSPQDVGWWQRELGTYGDDPPVEPMGFHELLPGQPPPLASGSGSLLSSA